MRTYLLMFVFFNLIMGVTVASSCKKDNTVVGNEHDNNKDSVISVPPDSDKEPDSLHILDLTGSARVSTPHRALFPDRKVINIVDGIAGDDPNFGWVPRVPAVSFDNPVLIAFSWDKPVNIKQIDLSWPRGWYFTDYDIASWDRPSPVILGAPSPPFEHKDLFVGGEGGYAAYRVPAIVVSKKGTILAFCEARKDNANDKGNIDLLVKRSNDGGETWSGAKNIYGKGYTGTIGNPVPIADHTGNIHVVFCKDNKTVLYAKSTDDGLSYSYPVDITEAVDEACKRADFVWGTVFTGPGHGIECSDGRLIAAFHVNGKKQGNALRRVGIIYSDDDGKTWLPGGVVPPTIGELSEASVFERSDNTLVINMRWHDGLYRATSESKDGGLTWSDPEPDKELPDPVCQGSIIRYSDDKNDPRVLFSNLNEQKTGSANRMNLTVRMSNDDGRTWDAQCQIVPGPSAYSDLAVTSSGSPIVLFENGTENYHEKLTFCKLSMDDFEVRSDNMTGDSLYDIKVAKSYIQSNYWNNRLLIQNNKDKKSNHLVFDNPVTTKTLFIAVFGCHQPDGYAYLQEVRILGYGDPGN